MPTATPRSTPAPHSTPAPLPLPSVAHTTPPLRSVALATPTATPVPAPPPTAAPTRAPTRAPPASLATATPHSTPAPLPLPSIAHTAAPLQSVAVATPATTPVPPPPPVHHSWVPTSTISKPLPVPPATNDQGDVAYQYAHRFDTPAPDDTSVPGIPVRFQRSTVSDPHSGPFHGVRALNGFSAERVVVSIPCGVRQFVQGPGFNEVTRSRGNIDQETGYIYIGGWGSGPYGVAVDAGLQKSSAQAERDEYSFYFKYNTAAPITSDMRFPCGGPDVVLELYPVANDLLLFSASGVNRAGKRVTLVVVQKTQPGDGWAPSGGSSADGIILKRVVSIAQEDYVQRSPRASTAAPISGSTRRTVPRRASFGRSARSGS